MWGLYDVCCKTSLSSSYSIQSIFVLTLCRALSWRNKTHFFLYSFLPFSPMASWDMINMFLYIVLLIVCSLVFVRNPVKTPPNAEEHLLVNYGTSYNPACIPQMLSRIVYGFIVVLHPFFITDPNYVQNILLTLISEKPSDSFYFHWKIERTKT